MSKNTITISVTVAIIPINDLLSIHNIYTNISAIPNTITPTSLDNI